MAFNENAEHQMGKPGKLGAELFAAIHAGKVDAVRDLLRRGAKPDSRDAEGNTALMFAVRENHEKIVDVLLAAGADPLLKNHAGLTALIFSASGGNLSIAKLLVDHYADNGVTDPSSPAAAEMARAKGNYDLAAMLEQKKAAALFNKAAKLKKEAEKKREAAKHHDDYKPVAEGIMSAIAGIYVLSMIDKVASKFHSFFTPANLTAELEAKNSQTVAPPAPSAPAPKPGGDIL